MDNWDNQNGPRLNIAILALLAIVSWAAALTLAGFVLWTIGLFRL